MALNLRNEELTDMHLAYGAAHVNAWELLDCTKRGSRIDICLDMKCLRPYIVA